MQFKHFTIAAAVAVLCVAAAVVDAKNCQLSVPGVGCVKVSGSSGWIEFCPVTGADKSHARDRNDDDCVSFRPFGFEELTADGSSVARVNNLRASVDGNVVVSSFPQICTPTTLVCANSTDAAGHDVPMNYTKIPISAGLTGSGVLHIDAYVMLSSGVLEFDNDVRNVAIGSYKFDIHIENYAFQATGAKVEFDIVVKNKGKNSNDVVASNSSIDNGAIKNFEKFAHRSSAGSQYMWSGVDVRTNSRGNQKVATFTFEGPFVDAYYDPLVDPVDGSASGAGGIHAAMCACLVAVLTTILFTF